MIAKSDSCNPYPVLLARCKAGENKLAVVAWNLGPYRGFGGQGIKTKVGAQRCVIHLVKYSHGVVVARFKGSSVHAVV